MKFSLKLLAVMGVNMATIAVASVIVLPSLQGAQAAAGYTANWEMTKCRVFVDDTYAKVSSVGGQFSLRYLYLGPAEWKVTYTSGSKTIIETWSVGNANWNNAIEGVDNIYKATTGSRADKYFKTVSTTETFKNPVEFVGKSETLNACDTTSFDTAGYNGLVSSPAFRYSGQYAFETDDTVNGSKVVFQYASGRSVPKKWTVTATVQ